MKSIIKHGITAILLLSVLNSVDIFAQMGFYDGYVITNQNDSVFGKIGTSQKRHVIKYCILKKDGENVNYYPEMMKRFGYLDGECYASNVLKDTIVQVLVQGKLSLYRFQSTLYVEKEKDGLYKLETYTETVMRNGVAYYVESVKWKGILTYLTSDCNTDPNAISKLNLLYKEIAEFVVNYNKCSKSEFIEYKSNNGY
jgi:hypothetical protein